MPTPGWNVCRCAAWRVKPCPSTRLGSAQQLEGPARASLVNKNEAAIPLLPKILATAGKQRFNYPTLKNQNLAFPLFSSDISRKGGGDGGDHFGVGRRIADHLLQFLSPVLRFGQSFVPESWGARRAQLIENNLLTFSKVSRAQVSFFRRFRSADNLSPRCLAKWLQSGSAGISGGLRRCG